VVLILLLSSISHAYQAHLIPTDISENDFFGNSISISNNYLVIGTKGLYSWHGSYAYIYKFNSENNRWEESKKLIPEEENEDIDFGQSVSMSGDYVAIGAKGDRGKGSYTGAVYIYKNTDTVWSNHQKLTATDGEEYDIFGCSVSIYKNYLIVGAYGDDSNGEYAAGSAYIFKLKNGDWYEQIKIVPSDGERMDYFGSAVSISENFAIIGSYNDDDNGENSGSVYIFFREGSSWSFHSKIVPIDGVSQAKFGCSVSISNNFALIGAEFDNENAINSGSAYVYQYNEDTDTWNQYTKLIGCDTVKGDNFGHSVAIYNSFLAIGSIYNNNGSVYIYQYTDNKWLLYSKLLDIDGSGSDRFGDAVSLSDNYIAVGASQDDEKNSSNSGSAYIFSKNIINNPPSVIQPINDICLPINFQNFYIVNLDTVFLDPENDALLYTATTDGNTSISILDNDLILCSKLGFSGISQITTTAIDGTYTSNHCFKVIVYGLKSSNIPIATDLNNDDTIQMMYNKFNKQLELIYTKKITQNERRELWYKSFRDNLNVTTMHIGYCLHQSTCPISIAINPNTKLPAVAYRDNNRGLIYSSLINDKWLYQFITNIGTNCSLSFDPSDNNPAIAFNSTGDYNLYYSKCNGSEWNTELLTYSDACYETLRFNPITGEIGISYKTLGWTNHASRLVYYDNERTYLDGDPEYVGGGNSLAFDTTGIPHITYFNHSKDSLIHTWSNNSEWIKEIIDDRADGDITSFIISNNNSLHVSYVSYDYPIYTLKYAAKNKETWYNKSILDSSNMSKWSSLSLDDNYKTHIAYIANGNAFLKTIYQKEYDLDQNGLLELTDAILVLKILTTRKFDFNSIKVNKIDISDAIIILTNISNF